MFDARKNFAYSTVATAPSPATSGTSLVVASGNGTRFPSAPFNLIIWPSGSQPLTTNAEIVRVTAISTDTFTITRTQEGTSARTVVVGDQVMLAPTDKSLADIEQALTGLNYIQSGALSPIPSNSLTATRTAMTGGGMFNGVAYPTTIAADAHLYTASKDTYVQVNLATGAYTYTAVTVGAAIPTLNANNQWVEMVTTDATKVTAVRDMRILYGRKNFVAMDGVGATVNSTTQMDASTLIFYGVPAGSGLLIVTCAAKPTNGNLNLSLTDVNNNDLSPFQPSTSGATTAGLHSSQDADYVAAKFAHRVLVGKIDSLSPTNGILTLKLRGSMEAGSTSMVVSGTDPRWYTYGALTVESV